MAACESCGEVFNDRFQSLFSWNLLLMGHGRASTRNSIVLVSILVFVELALDAGIGNRICDVGQFQSLFSWNLLLMPYIRA